MTAEIVIMNKESVALATDSAVTSGERGNEKIFPSANKLFTLSKYQPVGIMVYGNATLLGIPWETIIKVYRNELSIRQFDTLEEYADNFVHFLDDGNPIFPDSVQEQYVEESLFAFFDYIKNQIISRVQDIITEAGEISDEDIQRITSDEVGHQYNIFEKTDNIPSIPVGFNRSFLKKYDRVINKAIKNTFEELPLSRSNLNRLKKIAASLFSKFPDHITKEDISGVVIAGFGSKDIFPSLKSFHIEGIANKRLKYDTHTITKIDYTMNASITPFAQIDMVQTFMNGVDPDFWVAARSYFSKVFDDYTSIVVDGMKRYDDKERQKLKETLTNTGRAIFEDYDTRLEDYQKQKNIYPILDVVSVLPKDELAAMAESLVNLTSFKRKVTMERETVGGPVDVAVISKGDGFIWIKRKHYFKPELNPQFFANYYKEMPHEHHEE